MTSTCQRCGREFRRKAANGKYCPCCQKKRSVERSDQARKKRLACEKRQRQEDREKAERDFDPIRSPWRKCTAIYQVISSPCFDGIQEWPIGAMLSRIEVDQCLITGYFPVGMQILQSKTGEIFRVKGKELHRQRLELVK